MRYSNTSVEQFHLGRLVEGIADGKIAIPEFQRDFDWNENDIRSLLSTVFSGWPAGSLLLLEGESPLFKLRPMENAPDLNDVLYAVLDGQQRLTSLYQALYSRGDSVFAIRWDLPADQDIEECIVSVRRRSWERNYQSIAQNLEHRLVPVSALKSPTAFFTWRDEILAAVQEPARLSPLRELITNLYTYRLSAIHDYEFPVVKIDKKVEPSAIARIFEKVNKSGLTLNAFDLVVAKSFDAGWNLRNKWLDAKDRFPELNGFFGEDGLPLLQAISLLCKEDLRQSSVLELSKYDVQNNWDKVALAASSVVRFLRSSCGVLRRDFMPYLNLLPPFIALETLGLISKDEHIFSKWFWTTGFISTYDAAANTRLVSHYKAVLAGKVGSYDLNELRVVQLNGATRKSQKALWTTVNCAMVAALERESGSVIPDEIVAELEASTLFSIGEVMAALALYDDDYDADAEFRGALNTFLVPQRLASVTRKVGAEESLLICQRSEFGDHAFAQLPAGYSSIQEGWGVFRELRARWVVDFMKQRGVTGCHVAIPNSDMQSYEMVDLESVGT